MIRRRVGILLSALEQARSSYRPLPEISKSMSVVAHAAEHSLAVRAVSGDDSFRCSRFALPVTGFGHRLVYCCGIALLLRFIGFLRSFN